MHDVFVSHVEEDRDVALQIALGLEERGYSTWCYEVDSVAGLSYLSQTAQAIRDARIVLPVISEHMRDSPGQVQVEIVRAHEERKRFIPVLSGLSHAAFQRSDELEELRQALGAAASVRMPPEGVPGLLPRIIEGLEARGVRAAEPARSARIDRIRTELGQPSEARRPRQERAATKPGRNRAPINPARYAWPVAIVVVAGLLTYVGRGALRDVAGPRGQTAVGVMEMHPRFQTEPWMCDFTRDGLNTVLSQIDGLRVFSKEKIDFLRDKRSLTEIEAAELLGITKMINGTVELKGNLVTLEARVVDIATGILEQSRQISGREDQLVELQNEMAVQIAKGMGVRVAPERVKRIFAERTNADLENYRMLTESLGAFGVEEHGRIEPRRSRGVLAALPGPATAWAGDGADESSVRAVLEAYRLALQEEDLDKLAAVQVSMSQSQRDALSRYFENSENLRVQFSDYDILIEGAAALATFTRSDVFQDAKTGREVKLAVRISSQLAKDGDAWKIVGLKKPS